MKTDASEPDNKGSNSITSWILLLCFVVLGYLTCLGGILAYKYFQNGIISISGQRIIINIIEPWVREWTRFGMIISLILLVLLPLLLSAFKSSFSIWSYVISGIGFLTWGLIGLSCLFGSIYEANIKPVIGMDGRKYGVHVLGGMISEQVLTREKNIMGYARVWEVLNKGLGNDCGPRFVPLVLPRDIDMSSEPEKMQLDVSSTGWIVLHKGEACYMAYNIKNDIGYGVEDNGKGYAEIEKVSPFVMIGPNDVLPHMETIDLSKVNIEVLAQDRHHPNPEVRRIVTEFLGQK